MEKREVRENKVDAFVDNMANTMADAKETINEMVNGAADFIEEVKTSETYNDIKDDVTDIAEKTAKVGKAAFKLAKAVIKSKLD